MIRMLWLHFEEVLEAQAGLATTGSCAANKDLIQFVNIVVKPGRNPVQDSSLRPKALQEGLPQQELLLEHKQVLPTLVDHAWVHELDVHQRWLLLVPHRPLVARV